VWRRHNYTQQDVFSPDDSTAIHTEQLEWLKGQIRTSMEKGKKAVVLTHHTPSYQVDGTVFALCLSRTAYTLSQLAVYKNSGSGLAFSSSLEYLFKDRGTNVALWAHGHTHYNDDRVIGTLPPRP
jgi:hypothetical protein